MILNTDKKTESASTLSVNGRYLTCSLKQIQVLTTKKQIYEKLFVRGIL